ncbi:hypothetical protein B0G76_3872 [Paraburkholderia sp. BL23I1N1]|uniref:hypothetical protein n=1 Tax=Paraburkholderia sp. BL23I1N1 TaxID=1938802 RepID=UPI000FEF7BFD|nr:hypothetical protein [Paraburkholderia sp. BL23I1N1]RKE37609.1 hypothetical protein B0G76_3872 [Paraburkholderia sp. BL23I1N1]
MPRWGDPASNSSCAFAQPKWRATLLVLFVGSMWAVWFVSAVPPFLHLTHYGVVPHTLGGLVGILYAPWLGRRQDSDFYVRERFRQRRDTPFRVDFEMP